MSRPVTRTVEVNLDVINAALSVFGTYINAHEKLGLTALMTYPVFYRAMTFNTVRPQEKTAIEDAWDRWKELFLRPEIPEGTVLAVTESNLETEPEWFPAAKRLPKRRSA